MIKSIQMLLSIAVAAVVSLSVVAVEAKQQITISPISGSPFDCSNFRVSDSGQIVADNQPTLLTVDDLREIRFATVQQAPNPNSTELILRGGGSILVDDFSVSDEQCRFSFAGKGYTISIDQFAGFRLNMADESSLFERGRNQSTGEVDRLYLQIDGQVQSAEGVIEEIKDGKLIFQFGGETRELSQARIYGGMIADFGEVAERVGNATVTTTDGTSFRGELVPSEPVGSETQAVKIAMIGDLEIVVPYRRIAKISIRSGRLIFLSDESPLETAVGGLVTATREPTFDRNVMEEPLRLQYPEREQPVEFEKGIGTHAECRLDFSNAEGFDQLVATIGLDANNGRRGDCEFVVLGDGRELFRKRMKGTDPPYPLSVDITESSIVSLVVEAGENLDLGDHANWCEARFVRNSSSN